MKLNLSIFTGVASLAALMSGAFADTATTEPVGYITVKAEGAASKNTFTTIAPTLVNKTEYSGAITAITATTITVGSAPFALNQFQNSDYYVEITNGAGEGAWTNITGTPSTASITVPDDMQPFAAIGSMIRIRKHVTVSQFLGTPTQSGLVGGFDPGTADSVVIRTPGENDVTLFYDTASGYWSDDVNFADESNRRIEPGQGLIVARTQATTDTSWTFVGHVKTGKTKISVLTGDNVIAIPVSTGLTLGTSGLEDNAAPKGVSGLNVGGDPATAGDFFTLFDPNGAGINTTYFHDGFNWSEDVNYGDESGKVLSEGSALYITRSGAPFVWTAPAQFIAP